MKYVRQFWIILLISAMGEALHVLIPLPVPASVYGLVIMLIALGTHIIRLEQVKEAAEFVNASSFIEKLPQKYDSKVFERGGAFSAGQRPTRQ